MTPEALADLHARCFSVPRPFSAREFASFLAKDWCFLLGDARGFALGSAAAGEAELLTLVVDPTHRRTGLGSALLRAFETEAQARGAEDVFLEVAANNLAAQALYRRAGYRESGQRHSYYRQPDGSRIDAILMTKPLVAVRAGVT